MANQEEKITVKIATQQKQENLASLTSIDKSVHNDTAAALTPSSLSSLKSINNSSGSGSYSHSSNNNSNKSQQYQQRFHNKPQYNNNHHYNNGFQQKDHSISTTTASPLLLKNNYYNNNNNNNYNSNNGINSENIKNYKNINNIKGNNNIDNNINQQSISKNKINIVNGQLNSENKKYNINNSGINNNTNNDNVGVNNTSTNSENFSYGFSKNFAKIRQHDSDVSPRPRRPYQNDSSSRYYNKSSDGTGQGRIISGDTVNSRNIPTSIGEGGGGGNRRQFINSNIDYNNSLNPSSGYNNRSITPPDPIKGGGFNNTNNIGSQQGGSYINKNHVRSNIPYQQQQQQQSQQQYNNYKNPYNNGRENNYYNKHNENGSGGGNAGGRPQYNRGSGNSGIGELRDYSPSASPNLNGGPRLASSLQRNIGNENNRGLSNHINNRGPSYDNNGSRRPINNSSNNNYNSLERGIDRNDRDRDRDRGIDKFEKFDRDRSGFDRVGIDRDRTDRERNERYPLEREKRFEHIEKVERGPLPPSVLRPDSRPLLSENSNNIGRQPYQGRDSGNYSPQSSSASPVGGSPKRDDTKGNGGTSKSEEKSVDRWIPPSLRSQHVLTQQDKNDAVFRKVRGILNKLTPEKFQDLCEELLKIDLRSTSILNGVVLLIFEKALDEPKYSSMYAQVCKRLKDEASNYEDNPQHASTFIRILLNVCRDKFYNPSVTSSSNSNKNSNNNSKSSENISNTNIKFDSKNLSEKDREYYDKENDDEITTEEEERRHVAKQRVLGNVKFIGELSKLQMLSTSIIHRIIQDLFERKKRPDATLQDWCEDMECLCQLIRTCGKDLDSKPSKKLMEQYIAKMDQRSKSTEYPPRIRFMLRDIIELRENNWVPRKVTATEGPVPIRQIRTDDDSVIRPPYISRNRDFKNNDRDSDHWMNRLPLNLQSSNFSDMFSSLSVTGASPIMSPGGYNNRNQRNNQNNYNNYNNNRYNKHNNQLNNMHGNNSVGSGLTGTNQFNNMLNNKDLAPRFKKSLITTAQESIENIQMRPQTNSLIFKANMNIKPPMLPISTPLSTSGGSSLSSGSSNIGITGLGLNNSSLLTSQQQTTSNSKLDSLNTSSNSSSGGVVLSISGPPLPRVSSAPNSSGLNESLLASSSSHGLKSLSVSVTSTPVLNSNVKDDDILLVTKHGSIEKPKGKKDKGPGKEKIIKQVITFLHENIIGAKLRENITSDEKENELTDNSLISNENNQQEDGDMDNIKNMNEILTLFYEIKVSDKHMKDATYAMLNEILDKSEQDHANVIEFLQLLRKDNKLQSNSLLDAFKQIVNKMSEKESTIPKITTIVASLLACSVQTKLCKLSDIAIYTEGGQHYPLILLVLQKLHKTMGRDSLEELFQQSKVDLMASLPEADRNKDRLAEILEDRKLTFLYPLLKVQQEMLKQIQLEDNPQVFYKWIKTNVDSKYHKDPGFITALMTVILKYVTQETTLMEGTDVTKNPEKSIIEKEEDLFQKYCHILGALLTGDTYLQLIAVYALQVFCFNARFPKGMLCRWFKNLYELNVIEEEAFLRWKEEVTDEYPGKGTSLFQVNQWLTWLENAESEDED